MKRITFLIASLGEGGAERVTTIIANHMALRGYSVQLIVFNDGCCEYEVNDNVKKVLLPHNKNKLLDIVQKIDTLHRKLKEFKPDSVVELGFAYRYLFFGGLLNKYRYIMSERNAPQYYHRCKIEMKMIEYCFLKADAIVFQTEDAKKYYPDRIASKGYIIPNPVKNDLPEPYVGDREKRVVAFSRLNFQKNIPLLLDAFKEFHMENSDYVLEIYGKGESEDSLKKYAENIGIKEYARFMGFDKNIHEMIRNAAMFVSSSDFEGISNSMIEALALGLPCICTDCPAGGARMAIQNGVNGFLIPVRDKKELTNKMKYVASHLKEMEGISEQAILVRKTMSVDLICDEWEKLI